MTWQSHEEVLARNKEAMGEDLGLLYTTLSNEVTWLTWQWHEFVQLYASKPSRVELLNGSAPFFFYMLQSMFWSEVLLGLSRLTGPPKSVGKDNLTLQRLPPLIADESLKENVLELVTTLRRQASFSHDWRNRHFAHRDLTLALGHTSTPLEPASKEKVDHCLDQAHMVMNVIGQHYLRSTTAYGMDPGERGAVELLYMLRDGLRRRSEANDMADRGEYRPEMFNDDLGPV